MNGGADASSERRMGASMSSKQHGQEAMEKHITRVQSIVLMYVTSKGVYCHAMIFNAILIECFPALYLCPCCLFIASTPAQPSSKHSRHDTTRLRSINTCIAGVYNGVKEHSIAA